MTPQPQHANSAVATERTEKAEVQKQPKMPNEDVAKQSATLRNRDEAVKTTVPNTLLTVIEVNDASILTRSMFNLLE